MTNLKIAYLCDLSPLEGWTYSGGNARIYNALHQQGAEIDIITPSWFAAEPLRRMIHRMPDSINLRARWRAHLLLSRIIGRGVSNLLKATQYDVLFCPYSFQSLAHVKSPKDTLQVFTADATPTVYRQSKIGQAFKSNAVSRRFDPMITRAETTIFQSSDLNLWPSVWQKERADSAYGLEAEKSLVVPWGANIPKPAGQTTSPPPTKGTLHLLLVGRDWFAKGGPLVFETLVALRKRGINAHLSVIGCVPPPFHTNDAMTVYPSLDKTDPTQFAQFEALFRAAHFLVMPSFESYGFAFCEASAYGLPSICLKLGGIPVIDGVNGHALETTVTADDFANCLQSYLGAPTRYSDLRKSARQYYETTLNWTAWGERVMALISERRSQK